MSEAAAGTIMTEPAPPARRGAPAAPTADLRIERGTARVLFAYDVGFSIDLNEAERLVTGTAHRAKLSPRRAPRWLEHHPAPLRCLAPGEAIEIGPWRCDRDVEIVVHDFGAVSIHYTIPLSCCFRDLPGLSLELYENDRLLVDSRRRVEQFVAAVRPAVTKAALSPFVEDYVVFHVVALKGAADPEAIVRAAGPELSQILRAEGQALSDQEVADALANRLSYGRGDLTLIDWFAALVIDPDGDDVVTILEYANVELLEMRFLDHQLDRALDQAYETLSRRRRSPKALFGSLSRDLHRISRLQADNAAMFEAVSNPLKLLGDQYLARVYRTASRRLHLDEWDAGILRKLQTLESIYSKLADEGSTRRMELLEWIIIVLIVISIVLPFVPGAPGH